MEKIIIEPTASGVSDVVRWLISEHGYTAYPQKEIKPPLKFAITLHKKVDSQSVCESQGFLNIIVEIVQINFPSNLAEGYHIDFKAQKNEKWWHFQLTMYRSQILDRITEAEDILVRLFNSI